MPLQIPVKQMKQVFDIYGPLVALRIPATAFSISSPSRVVRIVIARGPVVWTSEHGLGAGCLERVAD